jgi:hypothetical protein
LLSEKIMIANLYYMIIKLPFLPWDLNVQRVARNTVPSQTLYLPQTIIRRNNYNKIFCIGSAKTGTTSLETLLSQFGFSMGNQPAGEVLSRDWLIHKNAERIIKYCYTADAFQDAPFGYPGLYRELDRAFPNSKFILTIRDSPDGWFESLVRFHTKLFSSDPSRPPNEDDLKNATYRYKGYIFEGYTFLYGYPKIPLYDENAYKNHYVRNNDEKRNYFKDRPNDFIEINLAIKEDFPRLCEFLGLETEISGFPWLNRSE